MVIGSLPVGNRRWPRALAAVVVVVSGLAAPGFSASSLKYRLNERYLSTLHAGAAALQARARPSDLSGEFLDVRCVLHAHSRLSHDSRGTEEQIVAAAKAAGVRAIFTTEHPQADRRWITEGLSGERGGILFVPGAELSDGLLLWRTEDAEWDPGMSAGAVLEKVRGSRGLAFIAHPEKRKTDADWELPPFAGMEIYNSHADAEDSGYGEFVGSLRGNPVSILTLIGTLKKYQQAAYAAIFDENQAMLNRWDRLNTGFLPGGRRVVGIAGNDAHQNVGVHMVATEQGLDVRDALGATVRQVPKKNLPLLLLGTLVPGTPLLSHTFDPYEISFRYVSTHLLAPAVTEPALVEALRGGRAYVAFDWMADPSGFRFTAVGERTVEMGEGVPARERPELRVRTSMPCEIRLLRNGVEVRREQGAELTYRADGPGVYRVEAWVPIAEEQRPWIYSNPIYVTE